MIKPAYSPNPVIIIGGLLLLSSIMAGCVRNSPYQGRGEQALQGSWIEDTLARRTEPNQRVYTRYEFKFSCDSVYMKLHTHAQFDYFADPCYQGGRYTEYVKGTYVMRHDSLVVTGVYTHENFKMKVSGCYRAGNTRYWFTIKQPVKSGQLVLRNTDEHGPIFLIKRQNCSCFPKMIGPQHP